MDLIWTWLGISAMFGISAMYRVLHARWCPSTGKMLHKKAASRQTAASPAATLVAGAAVVGALALHRSITLRRSTSPKAAG